MDEAIFKTKFTFREIDVIRFLVESHLKFVLTSPDVSGLQKEFDVEMLDELHKKITVLIKNKFEEINLKEENNVQEK